MNGRTHGFPGSAPLTVVQVTPVVVMVVAVAVVVAAAVANVVVVSNIFSESCPS